MKTLSSGTVTISNNNRLNIYRQKEIIILKNNLKNIKKVIYEEELDSEPEVEDNDYASEEIKEEAEKTKPKKVQQK